MSPTNTTLFDLALALLAVVPPFLLGRWSAPACERCAHRDATARARHNTQAVVTLTTHEPRGTVIPLVERLERERMRDEWRYGR